MPGNPDAWDVTMPVALRLLAVARPGEARACPACGKEFASKRQDMCQCPGCGVVSRPFATADDALAIHDAALDAFGWGGCPRCGARRQFASLVEQCHRCGRLMRGKSIHPLDLADNARAVEGALARRDAANPRARPDGLIDRVRRMFGRGG